LRRFFEILPGTLSWSFLLVLFFITLISPATGALCIITFDLYWVLRISYLTVLLVLGHLRLSREEKWDWLEKVRQLQSPHGNLEDLTHAVLFPIYKEPFETLDASLRGLAENRYDLKKVVVVLAVEERAGEKYRESVLVLQKQYRDRFREILVTCHPDGIEGEARVKGANATWAARELKKWFDREKIALDRVIISCFDADTVCHPQYLACLSYNFLSEKDPHQASYQPIPVYHNNIWYAPSFARVVEVSSSFWQVIQSMRRDKLVTFSSHSMSFKTLVEIDYWPVDMISDDSAIFWKAFLHFNGDYHVISLYVTVSMDVAFDKGIVKTIVNQYKQKRRWAWGVENFPMLMMGFLEPNHVPFRLKFSRTLQLIEEHFTWATWAIILAFLGPFPILFGGAHFRETVLGFNLPLITSLLFGITSISFIICVIASFAMLPSKPAKVPAYRILTMCTQWLLIPAISAVIGSIPALDAQTRMALGKPLTFWVTPKKRYV